MCLSVLPLSSVVHPTVTLLKSLSLLNHCHDHRKPLLHQPPDDIIITSYVQSMIHLPTHHHMTHHFSVENEASGSYSCVSWRQHLSVKGFQCSIIEQNSSLMLLCLTVASQLRQIERQRCLELCKCQMRTHCGSRQVVVAGDEVAGPGTVSSQRTLSIQRNVVITSGDVTLSVSQQNDVLSVAAVYCRRWPMARTVSQLQIKSLYRQLLRQGRLFADFNFRYPLSSIYCAPSSGVVRAPLQKIFREKSEGCFPGRQVSN